jgi:hypothetical protein
VPSYEPVALDWLATSHLDVVGRAGGVRELELRVWDLGADATAVFRKAGEIPPVELTGEQRQRYRLPEPA